MAVACGHRQIGPTGASFGSPCLQRLMESQPAVPDEETYATVVVSDDDRAKCEVLPGFSPRAGLRVELFDSTSSSRAEQLESSTLKPPNSTPAGAADTGVIDTSH